MNPFRPSIPRRPKLAASRARRSCANVGLSLAALAQALVCAPAAAEPIPPAATPPPQPAAFQREMERELFAANPLLWPKRMAELRKREEARLAAEREALAAARRQLFTALMEEEWLAADPRDVIRTQKARLVELEGKLAGETKAREAISAAREKEAADAKVALDALTKRIDELTKKLDDQTKASGEKDKALDQSAADLKKQLEDARNESRDRDRRQTIQIGRLRARAMAPFEAATMDGLAFVKIPPGEFVMGTPPERIEDLRTRGGWTRLNEAETPARKVRITRPFLIGKFEVTQKLWQDVTGKNPSAFKGENQPVESVSWGDVAGFIDAFNQRTGQKHRLPTEAEWEYCARAGGEGLFGAGASGEGGSIAFENLGDFAWTSANSQNKPQPVGQRKPNAWGLHDMLGNVWEWCLDWYEADYYRRAPEADPLCDRAGTERVFRGGCWALEAPQIRAGVRGGNLVAYKSQYVGFRLVREIAGEE